MHPPIKSSSYLYRPTWFDILKWKPVLTCFVFCALLQDVICVFLEHRRFASSVICSDPSIARSAGRYVHVHCTEHAENGNFYLLTAWISALCEAHAFKLVAAGVALFVF
jgi:hypothetical protein